MSHFPKTQPSNERGNGMDTNGFKKLKVWEKAHTLVLEVYRVTKSFPEEEKFCLTAQVRRSAVSICANIVEGYRKTKKEFARYLDIAQGSLEETKYHLLLAHDLGYCDAKTANRYFLLCDEIGRMLFGLRKKSLSLLIENLALTCNLLLTP